MFEINPKRGFESLRLGTERKTVRTKFDDIPSSKKAVPWSISESDYYENGLRLSYDENDCLESIGFTPETTVTLIDFSLRNINFSDLIQKLEEKGYTGKYDKDDHVWYFDELGMSIFLDGNHIEAHEMYSGSYLDRKGKLEIRALEYMESL